LSEYEYPTPTPTQESVENFDDEKIMEISTSFSEIKKSKSIDYAKNFKDLVNFAKSSELLGENTLNLISLNSGSFVLRIGLSLTSTELTSLNLDPKLPIIVQVLK
jgi:hypothetical protein